MPPKRQSARPLAPEEIPALTSFGPIFDLGEGLPPARLLHFPQDFPGPGTMSQGMANDIFRPTRPPLTAELMIRAYAAGIFPMSDGADDPAIFWVDPQRRGVFPLDAFHISRSLRRELRKGAFEIKINHDFAGTVAGCADRQETWINAEINNTYTALYDQGYAHSLEVWMDGELAGGVFGVAVGAAFFGESMFSRRKNASKIALSFLVDRLRKGGFQLFDTQFTTDHLQSLGAIELPRAEYRRRLQLAVTSPANFFEVEDSQEPQIASRRAG